jgi:hypothetical protein
VAVVVAIGMLLSAAQVVLVLLSSNFDNKSST